MTKLKNMMKYSFIFFLTLLFSNVIQAQKCSQIDFDAIYKETENKKSKFYLPNLLKRFQEVDTTMTEEEYKHLYYGYTRTTYYSPLSMDSRELETLLKGSDIEKTKQFIEKFEKSNPVNLNLMYAKMVMALRDKNRDKAMRQGRQLAGFLKTIEASGDGKSPNTALVITAIEDEYFLLMIQELQYERLGASVCCDMFKITNKDKSVDMTLYFNKEKSSEYITKTMSEKMDSQEKPAKQKSKKKDKK